MASFPSPQHAAAAGAVVEFVSTLPDAQAVSLVGSCARRADANDLDHVPLMLRRDEPFHAFHRLYPAFQGFLQALFIAGRTYPIAYDKWIREQVEDILGLPELYARLPGIVGVEGLRPPAVAAAAENLRALLEEWAPPP